MLICCPEINYCSGNQNSVFFVQKVECSGALTIYPPNFSTQTNHPSNVLSAVRHLFDILNVDGWKKPGQYRIDDEMSQGRNVKAGGRLDERMAWVDMSGGRFVGGRTDVHRLFLEHEANFLPSCLQAAL
jgi:hypothetical protein